MLLSPNSSSLCSFFLDCFSALSPLLCLLSMHLLPFPPPLSSSLTSVSLPPLFLPYPPLLFAFLAPILSSGFSVPINHLPLCRVLLWQPF